MRTVPAARERPPLTKRLSPKHWIALDYVAAALLGVILFSSIRRSVVQVVETPYGFATDRSYTLTWPLAVFTVMVAVVAVAMRRRNPTLMLGVLLASSLLVTTLTSPANAALVYFLPVGYVLYLVAATYDRWQAAARVLIAVFATILADAVLMDLTGGQSLPHSGLASVALCVIIAWCTGYMVRQRRRYAIQLQDEAASKAVAEERLRIARELHDVVAHSMSVIAVQAGYGQYVIDTQPADARDALGAIQATSREALDEMRRMLGALRQADEGAEAGLAELDRLIARTASAGVRVEMTRCGLPRQLPASIDLSAYRIIQEALTNVVKHAHTSSCRVLIGFGPDELVLEVTDNGAGLPALAAVGAGVVAEADAGAAETSIRSGWGPAGRAVLTGGDGIGRFTVSLAGGGHGIIGMRERVTLLGGEFSAGPLPGYGFQVSAHIPLPAGRS